MKKKNNIHFLAGKISLGVFLLAVMFFNSAEGEYAAAGRRDPFVPLVGVAQSTSAAGIGSILTIDDVVLQGIVVGSDGMPYAIINGEIMKKGDQVERLSIIEIEDNEIVVKIDEESHVVKLYE